MKRSYVIAAILSAAAVAWIASGQIGKADRSQQALKPPADLSAMEQVPTVRVRRQEAERRMSEIILRGRTEAWRKVMIKAETFGCVEELHAEKGGRVTAGDLLVRLAPQDRPARLREAQALLAQRQMEYAAARSLSEKGYRAETQLAANKAALESAQAAVSRAEKEDANTTIRAPIGGLVGERAVEIGDFVDVGDPVLKILDLDPILAVAQISERDLARVSLGAAASVRLITGAEMNGKIRFIASEADPATRTFRIEVEIPNPTASIADGITAELKLPAEQVLAYRVSPAILTLADDGVVGVKILGPGNVAEFMPVQIIGDEPDGVWLSGLPEQVTFITVGQDFVTAGQTVQPVDEKTLAPLPAGDPS